MYLRTSREGTRPSRRTTRRLQPPADQGVCGACAGVARRHGQGLGGSENASCVGNLGQSRQPAPLVASFSHL